jgi:hypothetical protein
MTGVLLDFLHKINEEQRMGMNIFYGAFDGVTPAELKTLHELTTDGSLVTIGLLTDDFLIEQRTPATFPYHQRSAMMLALADVNRVIPVDQLPDDQVLRAYDQVVVPDVWQPQMPAVGEAAANVLTVLPLDSIDNFWHIKRTLINSLFTLTAEELSGVLTLQSDGQAKIDGVEKAVFWRFDKHLLILENDRKIVLMIFDLTKATFAEDGLLQMTGEPVGEADLPVIDELSVVARQNYLIHEELTRSGVDATVVNELRESVGHYDMQRAAQTNGKQKRLRVLFLLHDRQQMDGLLPLLQVLSQNERFEVKLYTFDLLAQSGMRRELDEWLQREGFSVIRAINPQQDIRRLRDWAPTYTFRQSADDVHLPVEFQTASLTWTKVAQVVGEFDAYLANHDLQQYAGLVSAEAEQLWRLFVPLPLSTVDIEVAKRFLIGEDTVKTVGSLLLPALQRSQGNWPVGRRDRQVFWDVHFADGLVQYAEPEQKVLTLAGQMQGLSFVMTPDVTWPAGVHSRWEELQNTGLALSATVQLEALADADVVVTSSVTTLYRGLILGRAVIFLAATGVGYSELGDHLLAAARVVHNWEEFESSFAELLADPANQAQLATEAVKALMVAEHPELAIIDDMLADYELTQATFGE